jgi:hypothetical protein
LRKRKLCKETVKWINSSDFEADDGENYEVKRNTCWVIHCVQWRETVKLWHLSRGSNPGTSRCVWENLPLCNPTRNVVRNWFV